jgi:hypothetical protein
MRVLQAPRVHVYVYPHAPALCEQLETHSLSLMRPPTRMTTKPGKLTLNKKANFTRCESLAPLQSACRRPSASPTQPWTPLHDRQVTSKLKTIENRARTQQFCSSRSIDHARLHADSVGRAAASHLHATFEKLHASRMIIDPIIFVVPSEWAVGLTLHEVRSIT